jgi:protein gp37
MKKEWALNIKRQCEEQNVAFFFKQWGTWGADGVKRSKKKWENARWKRMEFLPRANYNELI